jgi:hypothetical protein
MIRRIEGMDVAASSDNRYALGEGPRNRSLRVGDKERDGVSEILRRRHLEGRLDAGEFEDRLGRCLAAKTYAGLDELIADFPRDPDPGGWARQTGGGWAWPPLFLFLPAAVIAAIVFGGHVGWLAVPLFFFFVVRPLVWHPRGRGYRRGGWACGPRNTTHV